MTLQPVSTPSREHARPHGRCEVCGRVMVGSGTDTYDPVCELPAGHDGSCKSRGAIDQHRLSWPAVCALCGRKGVRGFILLRDGCWVCRSSLACERRMRGTGQVGVGVMRNYRA